MKIKFETMKVTNLSDFFNIGFHKDIEEDYMFNVMLFGRDYTLRFFKKNSDWSPEDWCEVCGESLEQA
jgi:hypothetical protein